jgi:hypothetical protein
MITNSVGASGGRPCNRRTPVTFADYAFLPFYSPSRLPTVRPIGPAPPAPTTFITFINPSPITKPPAQGRGFRDSNPICGLVESSN